MHFHVIMVLGCAITTNCVAPGHVRKIWRPETISHTSSFTFKVKTCDDIHFYAVLKPSDADYEYVLRAYNGKRGFIRYNHLTILDEGRPASLERCRDFQPYWISWGDGVLSTGTGWTVGQDVLMEYNTTISKLHLIRIAPKMVRVAADYILDDQNAAFLRRTPRSLYRRRASSVVVTTLSMIGCATSCREEPRCAAISYTQETHQCKLVGPFKSGTKVIMVLGCAITTNCAAPGHVRKIWRPETISHTSSFTFKVKTCDDIHFYAILKPSDADFEYVLRAYNGKRGFIRYNHLTILDEGRPASLERCRDFQPYWTSWGDGVLSTGTGWTVGQDVLMEYNTTISKLHLIQIAPKMVRVAADYILDDQNAAFLRRTPRSLYRRRASSVVVTTLSMIGCATSCREEPRCAAISYTQEKHQCKLVGPFKSGTKVASEELLLVTQRY